MKKDALMSENRRPPPQIGNKPGFLSPFAVAIAAFLCMMAAGMLLFSFGVFFKPMSSQFGWTRAETSGAASLFMLVSGLLGIVAGRLGDRFSPRLVIIGCGIIGGISFLLLSGINSLWQLYCYYGIIGGMGMSNIPPIISLVTRYYTKNRGAMTGVTMAGVGVGASLAAPVAAYLISMYGWQKSYLIMGCIILALVAVSFSLFLGYSSSMKLSSNEYIPSAKKVHPEIEELSFKQGMSTLSFWILGAIIFCTGFIQQGLSVHLVPGATDMGFSIARAAGILSMISLASLAGNFFAGIAVDKIGSWLSMVISLALMFVGLLVLLVSRDLWTFYLFAIIFGISWGVVVISRSVIIADLFGLHSHGAITGTILFLYSLGGTTGPLAAGYIFDLSQHYQLVYLMFTGLTVATILMTLPLRKSSKRI
jgi:MFS family permease